MAQVTIYTCDKCLTESRDNRFLSKVQLIINERHLDSRWGYVCDDCVKNVVRDFGKSVAPS